MIPIGAFACDKQDRAWMHMYGGVFIRVPEYDPPSEDEIRAQQRNSEEAKKGKGHLAKLAKQALAMANCPEEKTE